MVVFLLILLKLVFKTKNPGGKKKKFPEKNFCGKKKSQKKIFRKKEFTGKFLRKKNFTGNFCEKKNFTGNFCRKQNRLLRYIIMCTIVMHKIWKLNLK